MAGWITGTARIIVESVLSVAIEFTATFSDHPIPHFVGSNFFPATGVDSWSLVYAVTIRAAIAEIFFRWISSVRSENSRQDLRTFPLYLERFNTPLFNMNYLLAAISARAEDHEVISCDCIPRKELRSTE